MSRSGDFGVEFSQFVVQIHLHVVFVFVLERLGRCSRFVLLA